MTTIFKVLKNRPLSRKLLRGDIDRVLVVGGGEWGASRPIHLLLIQPVDGVISTKKLSETSFAGRNLFSKVPAIVRFPRWIGAVNQRMIKSCQ